MNELKVDLNQLDDEWVKQPNIYYEAASQASDARKDYEEARNDLEVVKAELDKAIREDPESYGVGKLTEAIVTQTIVRQKEYKRACQEVVNTRHAMDVANAYVGALDHKKTALTKLVDLFLSNYFSKPQASKGAKEKMEDVERRSVRRKGRRAKCD